MNNIIEGVKVQITKKGESISFSVIEENIIDQAG